MKNKHLLILNVYFAPRRFGGATIVAEQMARLLQSCHGWKVTVVTSMQDPHLADYCIRRYCWDGNAVIAINLPQSINSVDNYRHPEVARKIDEILAATKPDVAHVHCIQLLGAELLRVLYDRDIPVAITMHDCWWLCEKQFMVDRNGHYCFQKEISQDRCRFCVDDHLATLARLAYLRPLMGQASLLLFPSQFQMELYLANGADPVKSVVNKNGVRPPKPDYSRRAGAKTPVFGFVGGPGKAKGADLILEAARLIASTDVHVRIADAARNMGESWENPAYWKAPGKFELVNAYTQDTIDDFFGCIDVLLCPSQCKESFGLTVREALVRDVWVIATDSGGICEDLRPAANSSVIPLDGSSEPLAEAIEACLDRNDWATYVNHYKEDVLTVEQQASRLSGLLESLI